MPQLTIDDRQPTGVILGVVRVGAQDQQLQWLCGHVCRFNSSLRKTNQEKTGNHHN
jgi:hypothetical protein